MQTPHAHMAQHDASTSGWDSAVHLHLQDNGDSFQDSNVHILDGEGRVKKAIYIPLECPSLVRGGPDTPFQPHIMQP